MLKLPSPADALPLTLGKKLTEAPIKPSEEWDLVRHDSRGALWKNCAGGRLQFIPNPSTLGPRKPQAQTPERLQKALDSVGEAFQAVKAPRFKVGDLARYIEQSLHKKFGIRTITRIDGKRIYFDSTIFWASEKQLYPCDADGWIPFDPNHFPGVMDIEWRTLGGASSVWKMRPSVDAAVWAAQKRIDLSSWKPLL